MEFEAFVQSRGPTLLRFAWALTGDWHLAEDLVQDALVKAHRRWRTVIRADNPEAYVKRIVLHGHLSHRRLRRSGEQVVTEVHDGPGHPAVDVEERDRLMTALARLPALQRTVMVLRYYEDWPDSAIADQLGCSQSTVRTHASRARTALATLLEPEQSR